jgi:hypothetical protein
MGKKVVVTCYKTLSENLTEGAEENHNPLPGEMPTGRNLIPLHRHIRRHDVSQIFSNF